MAILRNLNPVYTLPVMPVALLLTLSAYNGSRKEERAFLKAYGGVPYMGTVQVDIILPDGSYAKTDYGSASAHFTDIGGGKIKMVVFGAIKNKNGDAGFAVDGLAREKSWKSQGDSVRISVAGNGMISGGGRSYPQQFSFSGKIGDTRLELTTAIKTLKATEAGGPLGTKFVFRYVLRRDVYNKSGAKKATCNKIVWQPQYIGNFDGSGTTIRVPRCVN